jgi:cytochrome P450
VGSRVLIDTPVYHEVHTALRDPYTYSSYPNNLVNAADGKFLPLELDPPEHTAFRHVLLPLFSPARMKALEQDIRAMVGRLIDGFAGRGSAVFIAEFAHELPTSVFLSLMGWPFADASVFSEATDIAVFGPRRSIFLVSRMYAERRGMGVSGCGVSRSRSGCGRSCERSMNN